MRFPIAIVTLLVVGCLLVLCSQRTDARIAARAARVLSRIVDEKSEIANREKNLKIEAAAFKVEWATAQKDADAALTKDLKATVADLSGLPHKAGADAETPANWKKAEQEAAKVIAKLNKHNVAFQAVRPMLRMLTTPAEAYKQDEKGVDVVVGIEFGKDKSHDATKALDKTFVDEFKVSVVVVEVERQKMMAGGDWIRQCWWPHAGTVGGFIDDTTTNTRYGVTNNHVMNGGEVCTGNYGFGKSQGKIAATDAAIDATIFHVNVKPACKVGATTIKGSANPAPDQPVWKLGARTGLTRGKTGAVGKIVEVISTNAGGNFDPTTPFIQSGDSGSFLMSQGDQALALLHTLNSYYTGRCPWCPLPYVRSFLGYAAEGTHMQNYVLPVLQGLLPAGANLQVCV